MRYKEINTKKEQRCFDKKLLARALNPTEFIGRI